MSSTQLIGAISPRREPRPRGGHQQPIQAKIPATLGYELFKVADETSVQRTDMGGYLIIPGWNQLRSQQELPPIPMPYYLEAEVQQNRHAEIQDALIQPEESRFPG